jgi:hypothetical protein
MRQSHSLNWELSAEKSGPCEVKAIHCPVTGHHYAMGLWKSCDNLGISESLYPHIYSKIASAGLFSPLENAIRKAVS